MTAPAQSSPLFSADAPVNAVLNLPFSQLYRQARQAKQLYLPGHVTYKNGAGQTVRLPVKARARGNFRRENCSRPPLRLNFKKSQPKDSLFAGQDKLKLVNPCTVRPTAEEDLILEYLAYQVYGLLTDYSFKTRLLRLSFQDSDGKMKPWTTAAFLIEDAGEMSARLGGDAVKQNPVPRSALDPTTASRVELFQYLIGNTDFSMVQAAPGQDCCHNVKLINEGTEAEPRYMPVAYDFDSSGLVDAPYAEPAGSLPIKRVRQRFYMGYCRAPEHLDAAIAHFQARKAAVTDLFAKSPMLTERTRKRTLSYVDDFYKLLDSPQKVERDLSKRCRG